MKTDKKMPCGQPAKWCSAGDPMLCNNDCVRNAGRVRNVKK